MAEQGNNAPQTGKNEEQAIQQANEDKQQATSTISVRIPYGLKARLYDLSEQAKMTLNAYVATRIYKVVHGEYIHRDQLESESNLHKQAIEDLNKIKEERDQANKKLYEVKGVKQELDKTKKALSQAQSEKGKTDDKNAKRIQQLEKELNQYKEKLKEKESTRKSLAAKNEQLEQRIKDANEWAENTPFVERRF